MSQNWCISKDLLCLGNIVSHAPFYVLWCHVKLIHKKRSCWRFSMCPYYHTMCTCFSFELLAHISICEQSTNCLQNVSDALIGYSLKSLCIISFSCQFGAGTIFPTQAVFTLKLHWKTYTNWSCNRQFNMAAQLQRLTTVYI